MRGFHIKRLREELKAKILILMKSRPYLLHMNIMITWHIYQLLKRTQATLYINKKSLIKMNGQILEKLNGHKVRFRS